MMIIPFYPPLSMFSKPVASVGGICSSIIPQEQTSSPKGIPRLYLIRSSLIVKKVTEIQAGTPGF
jgi:hypothetical protein